VEIRTRTYTRVPMLWLFSRTNGNTDTGARPFGK